MDKIGVEYGLSRATVARLLRIAKLIPDIQQRIDSEEIGIYSGVEISYLTQEKQNLLNELLISAIYSIDIKKAEQLRGYSSNGKLDEDKMIQILSGKIVKEEKNSKETHTDNKFSAGIRESRQRLNTLTGKACNRHFLFLLTLNRQSLEIGVFY